MAKASQKKMEYIANYEADNYDKVLIRLPKGTKARVQATGETINGFVNRLVKAELDGPAPASTPTQPAPNAAPTAPANIPDQFGMEYLRVPLPASMHYNERISEAVYNGAAKSEKIFVMQALERRLHEADQMME